VLIGRGRDALDVAMVTAYGSPRLAKMTVWADEVVSTANDAKGTGEARASLLSGNGLQE